MAGEAVSHVLDLVLREGQGSRSIAVDDGWNSSPWRWRFGRIDVVSSSTSFDRGNQSKTRSLSHLTGGFGTSA
jgi:hypothetical protein